MKHNWLMPACFKAGMVALAVTTLSACGDKKEFTGGRAEDAIEELDAFQDSANVARLTVGYYEENSAETRLQLRQLAANGMLTYKAEQINEYIPASLWRSARTKEHVFVTVALTEEGKKYIVTEPVKDKEALKENKNRDKEYPENSVSANEQIQLLNPQQEEAQETTSTGSYSSSTDRQSSRSSNSSAEQSLYEKAKDREHTTHYLMLAFQLKVDEVRNLICTEDNMKEGKATCDAVLKVKKSTPFGRILHNVYEGDLIKKEDIKFFYYIDKGWTVKN